jgi:hypothetical protein
MSQNTFFRRIHEHRIFEGLMNLNVMSLFLITAGHKNVWGIHILACTRFILILSSIFLSNVPSPCFEKAAHAATQEAPLHGGLLSDGVQCSHVLANLHTVESSWQDE